MAYCHPLTERIGSRPSGIDLSPRTSAVYRCINFGHIDSSIDNVQLHYEPCSHQIIDNVQPSTTSNFTMSHAAPDHDLWKFRRCFTVRFRNSGFNSSPGKLLTYVWAHLQTGTVAELAAILHFSHHSGRSSSDFNLRSAKDMQRCVQFWRCSCCCTD